MKNFILVALCVFIVASLAQAKVQESTSSQKSKFDIRVPVKSWLKDNKNNFRVSVATGTLETTLRSRTNGFDASDSDINSNNLQMSFGYEKLLKKNFGYSTYLTYQKSSIDLNNESEEITNIRISGNSTFRLSHQATIYGGLNYGSWYGYETLEDSIDPGIGYQAGISFKIHKKAIFEMEYLSLINEGRLKGINFDLQSKGIILKMKMPLTLNI